MGKGLKEIHKYKGDIPLHVSTLTLLLIAWDRHRFLKDPMKPRIPAFVCATGSWLTAICLVLPYPVYTTYMDLGFSNFSPPMLYLYFWRSYGQKPDWGFMRTTGFDNDYENYIKNCEK
uniref:Uncharacterized protein n=1 Tax=Rhodnius prolixus TaxID=13249 RepID=T1HWE4_RHOPR